MRGNLRERAMRLVSPPKPLSYIVTVPHGDGYKSTLVVCSVPATFRDLEPDEVAALEVNRTYEVEFV
jgi:hypothetical protein